MSQTHYSHHLPNHISDDFQFFKDKILNVALSCIILNTFININVDINKRVQNYTAKH